MPIYFAAADGLDFAWSKGSDFAMKIILETEKFPFLMMLRSRGGCLNCFVMRPPNVWRDACGVRQEVAMYSRPLHNDYRTVVEREHHWRMHLHPLISLS
jgi:hypothetical protein